LQFLFENFVGLRVDFVYFLFEVFSALVVVVLGVAELLMVVLDEVEGVVDVMHELFWGLLLSAPEEGRTCFHISTLFSLGLGLILLAGLLHHI